MTTEFDDLNGTVHWSGLHHSTNLPIHLSITGITSSSVGFSDSRKIQLICESNDSRIEIEMMSSSEKNVLIDYLEHSKERSLLREKWVIK